MKLKVLSFNVLHFENYKTGEIDFDFFADAIRKVDPDIVGFNEVHGLGVDPEYEAQAEIVAGKLGMHCFFAKATNIDGDNPFGNAILSKYPVLSAEIIHIPDPENPTGTDLYETRCILKVKLDVAGGLDVYVTHFGLNRDELEIASKTVCENVCGRCIFMGDLNVTPDNDILDPIKKILKDTANENEEMLSFPSDKPFKKIDYIFIGEGIKKISSSVLPMVVSDHRPYYAELEI